MSFTWDIQNDYDIKILDSFSGEYVSLGQEDFCSVIFDGVGSPELRDAVYEVSGGDGVHFGREYYGMVKWTISGTIHSGTNKRVPGDPANTWNAWSQLARAWINYPERQNPRAVVPMYFKRPGREEMVVYGRPDRIDPDIKVSHSGFIAYTALFRQSDPTFYAADESSVTVLLVNDYRGGLFIDRTTSSFILPFTTSGADARTGIVQQDGDTNTPVELTIHGPVLNPSVTLIDPQGHPTWTVKLNLSIAAGNSVTIDTRQWARTIVTSTGASVAGAYYGPKLQDVVIPPGRSEMILSGQSGVGAAICQLQYRNAWSST